MLPSYSSRSINIFRSTHLKLPSVLKAAVTAKRWKCSSSSLYWSQGGVKNTLGIIHFLCCTREIKLQGHVALSWTPISISRDAITGNGNFFRWSWHLGLGLGLGLGSGNPNPSEVTRKIATRGGSGKYHAPITKKRKKRRLQKQTCTGADWEVG